MTPQTSLDRRLGELASEDLGTWNHHHNARVSASCLDLERIWGGLLGWRFLSVFTEEQVGLGLGLTVGRSPGKCGIKAVKRSLPAVV